MTPYYLYDAARNAFASAIQDEKDRLARGDWKTEGEARKLVGKVKGLERAIDILKDEYGKIERLDEEEHDDPV